MKQDRTATPGRPVTTNGVMDQERWLRSFAAGTAGRI